MKYFCNILDALDYHKNCCVCQNPMRNFFIHGEPCELEYRNDYMRHSQIIKVNLSASTDSDTDDILTICPTTNSVNLESNLRYKNRDYGFDYSKLYTGSTFAYKPPVNNYSGTLYEGLDISCFHCNSFNYTIQLIIDLEKEHRIQQLFLNSEEVVWSDENNQTYVIRNAYTIGKTEYKYKGQKIISVPLIPLNFSDPGETVKRLKVLNTFS